MRSGLVLYAFVAYIVVGAFDTRSMQTDTVMSLTPTQEGVVIVRLAPAERQKILTLIDAIGADLSATTRPSSLTSNAKPLTTAQARLDTVRKKINNVSINNQELENDIQNLLKAMMFFDEHNRASILLGVHDLYALLPAKNAPLSMVNLQQKIADLIMYFINKAQSLQQRSRSLMIRADARSSQLAEQAAQEAAYYYQLALNLADALLARGLVAITATNGTTMRLADINKKAAKGLELLPSPVPQAIQDSFKPLMVPIKN